MGVELYMDLPGVRKEDVSVNLIHEGEAIKISGTRKYRSDPNKASTAFEQSFTVDDSSLDIDGISAQMSDGVLVVTVPNTKKVAALERKIPITKKEHIEEDSEDDENMPDVASQKNADAKKKRNGLDENLEITEEDIS